MTRIEQMIQYCESENIYWFSDLAEYCLDNRRDWLKTLATDHGGKFMGLYLASKAHKAGLLTNEQYAEWVEDD